ncbi:MAG: hypothetical protein HY835_04195 [Anaerolineae bacterium]|nr:hypothetical protein [Anaerolineae bacterium]
METRTYKAETMRDALLMIQKELGPEAIVLSAREVPLGSAWNVWKRPGIELVAVLPDKNSPAVQTPARPTADADEAAGIEWVTDTPAPAPKTVREPARESAGWQPKRITREEARLANRPVEAPAPVQAPVRTASEEERRQATAALSAALAEIKAAQQAAPSAPALESEERAAPAEVKTAVVESEPAGLNKVRRALMAQEVDSAIIQRTLEITLEMANRAVLSDEEIARNYTMRLLEAELHSVAPALLANPRRVTCLVGASGSGKTSTAARLAVYYGKKMGRKVIWACADTLRTGAIGQARAYTDALGLPVRNIYAPNDLKLVLAESEPNDLILVDTPGYNPFREDQMVELGSLLTDLPERSIFMVAPANVKESDLNAVAGALSVFGIDGVIASKLDETFTYGSVYNFLRKAQLPLGYYTAGKETAGGLEMADPHRLVAGLFGKGWRQ